jgi:hypothetical protein
VRTFIRLSTLLISLLAGAASPSSALSLGDAKINSFIGEPLDVRIAVKSGPDELLVASCVSATVRRGAQNPPMLLPQRRVRVEETLNTKTLRLRAAEPFDEPIVRLQVRVTCTEESPVTRDYLLVLDPRPVNVLPAIVPGDAAADGSATARVTLAGRPSTSLLRVREGDSLESIALGFFPKSADLQAAFVVALRELNPELGTAADRLAVNSTIHLPDLKVFARQGSRPATAAAAAKIGHTVVDNTAQVHAVSNAPATLASTPATPATPPSPAPVTAKSAGPDKPAITIAKTAAPQGEFRLKLSGAEIDLSRSRGITEAMRGNLRDKQLILDADDQIAAQLTIKNTVKQLESRLNQMQLKLSTQAQSLAAPVTAPAPEKSAAAPAQAALPPVAQQKPVTPPVKSAPRPTSPVSEKPWWTDPWIRLAPILVLVLGAAWWWRRRRTQPDERASASASALPPGENSDTFSDWANVSDSDFEPDPVHGSISPQPEEVPPRASWREPLRPAVLPAHANVPVPAPILQDRPETQAAVGFAPPPLNNMAASLERDMRPAIEVDFPLMMEESGEDKERRRRYIEMRYPEVANKTVTVNDPDSVINAARQYFEEGQVQRAAELLTYAFEERPGQLRFWLALFEIYRLERMTAEFSGLAAHFRDFHSGTDVWPKVQHIGRDLDSSNPLFAAALGRLGLPVDREFDPIAENWLSAPTDFTSDVLMAELRRNLLDEYGVDSAQLQGLQPVAAS